MVNPFAEKYITDVADSELIESALKGNKHSLEKLIYRHQAWIYNIALRMVFYPQEAEDVTQEILIKIITKLSTFRGNSSFRTWVYRIVVNHVLNMKKSVGEKRHADNFDSYWQAIENTPDHELPRQETYSVEMRTLVNEVRVSCMTGMLLCLDREQRLVYIFGVIFQVTDRIAAEILEITRDNYRQRLSRARKDMYNFMHNKCGLMNKNNPCSCEKKTKALIESGYVNPGKLLFNMSYVRSVESVVEKKLDKLSEVMDTQCGELFRENPFQDPPDFVESLRKILEQKEFREIFNFTN